MKSLKSPCKNCEKRYFGCHSECQDYLDFRKRRDKYIADAAEKTRLNNDIWAVGLTMKKRGRRHEDYSIRH